MGAFNWVTLLGVGEAGVGWTLDDEEKKLYGGREEEVAAGERKSRHRSQGEENVEAAE